MGSKSPEGHQQIPDGNFLIQLPDTSVTELA